MQKFIILLLTIFNLCLAQSDSLFEKTEDMVCFSSPSILRLDSIVDGIRVMPYSTYIRKITVSFETTGSSDSTVIDIKKYENDTAVTILGSGNYPVIYAGDNRMAVIFPANKAIQLEELDMIRMDFLRVAKGLPRNFKVCLYLRKGAYRE